jgi:uncharacterized protein YqeY
MGLKSRISDDLKAALLSGDRFAGETLRSLKAAILNEEVAQGKRDEGLTDEVIEQIVAREVKKRNESAELYAANDRAESAADELHEADILKVYLPVQIDENALRSEIQAIIAATGASSMADMGKTIGAAKAKFGNAADGAMVAKIVKELLA